MECPIIRIITFDMPITFGEVKIINKEGIDVTLACEYAWSTDKVCWTNWVNYNTYLMLVKNLEGDFWLRIKIFGSLDKVLINNNIVSCYNVMLDTSNVFMQQLCNSTNLFSPYTNLDCALLLQQQLADLVICMFGIPIYYFRVLPDKDTADYTFKEYVLHNVVAVKQLKLMVEDGTMPSSKPNFSEFDFDWEVDWEVELSKTAFAGAFGNDAFPKHQDFIYVPMMKRMWSVNAAYDEKNEGLLWRSTTWKLGLVKYNEYTNVDTDNFDSIIDDMVVNKYQDIFGKHERIEQERLSGTNQTAMPRIAANALYNVSMQDAIREEYNDKGIEVVQQQLNHGTASTVLNFYNFKCLPDTEEFNGIVYQKDWCYDSGMVSFIVEMPKLTALYKYNPTFFANVGYLEVYIEDWKVNFNGLSRQLEAGKTYLVVVNFNKKNMTSDLNVYEHKLDPSKQNVPIYRIRPEMYSFDFSEPNTNMITTTTYNDDFKSTDPQPIFIHGSDIKVTNFKVYNRALSHEEALKECVKYSTNHPNCLIDDLARPFLGGAGFAVR